MQRGKNKVSSVVDDCCNVDGVVNLFSAKYQDVCIAWHKGLRRSCDLHGCIHSLFVPAICGLFPLKYELACRQTFFIDNCLNSVNSVVEFVARNGYIFHACTRIPLLAVQHSFAVYFLRLSYVILEVLNRRLA